MNKITTSPVIDGWLMEIMYLEDFRALSTLDRDTLYTLNQRIEILRLCIKDYLSQKS